ncbi:MAG: ABC transporter ATP-binding protein [Pseudomonadota bacterium]|uniref:Putative ABC transport system ATP-binding protein n=1 Tax=Gallaecimonas pentaromativorans TaxID=584787 RepID=A0A3N1PPA2_9GAMM|nr:ABC transporter ATP-binding protein [Gallaecimonas pentaromativorans]MED5524239.1 ABC transporter ATP-binding protein [Pseudomonadota bacterium]ROQ29999.1 putative ABC transport system ATP-binding protein [Gallaecimonas pentaromativorans]
MSNAVIEVRQLAKSVVSADGTALEILSGVELKVEAGQTLAIMGASGSGKSTLLGLLAGLDQPSKGSVSLSGKDMAKLSEDELAALRASELGFVFQQFLLIPSLTALENVMMPAELKGDRDARPRASELLERVGLGKRLGHFPAQLSGGEQQRVAIARAFITNPALLFADEPTGNLDTHTGEHVADLLFALNRDFGTTLILVTHDPVLARRCQRVLSLKDGRLEVQDDAA